MDLLWLAPTGPSFVSLQKYIYVKNCFPSDERSMQQLLQSDNESDVGAQGMGT